METIETDVLIIGAGPCGLFQIFELGLLGIRCHLVDALPYAGGQCAELYPSKPIYDIPALPVCGAQELIDRLLEQAEPFKPVFHFQQQVVSLEKVDDEYFIAETTLNKKFITKAIIIAGGVGSFQPMPLRLPNVDELVDHSIFYKVKDPKQHQGKKLVILGGGDSALDWVLELVQYAEHVTLIHRSDNFKAAPDSVHKMRDLVNLGKMDFILGNVSDFTSTDKSIKEITVTMPDKTTKQLSLDHLLIFFGLSPKLGPIAEWGLNLEKNQIATDTEKFETSVPGIYAVGDISTYPGKKKLILSGFHEAALAAFAIKARIEPDKKVFLQYTTTSPIMHERLGVQEDTSS